VAANTAIVLIVDLGCALIHATKAKDFIVEEPIGLVMTQVGRKKESNKQRTGI
jgi:hypothetical protein